MGRLTSPEEAPPDGKTPLTDQSGLLARVRTQDELNVLEFSHVSQVTTKYLIRRPSKKKAPFTYEWFLKVHREMFGKVWTWAGEVRKSDKNIGIDKLKIRDTLKMLEKDFHCWIASSMNPDEVSARLHHRLVWIHPVENGNGRWARLIANIYLRQNGLPLVEWPDQVLLTQTDLRKKYLDALHQADQHNLQPLMKLQRGLQR